MARPTKYTPELRDQLAGYIGDGLTVRDACFGARISEDTFWRWNREKLDFTEAIKKATSKQKWSSEALVRTSEYRRYTRRAQICCRKALKAKNLTHTHLEAQKHQKQALAASEGLSVGASCPSYQTTQQGILPIRLEPPTNSFGELVPSKPYYNQTTGKVEWIEKELYGKCVLHRCELILWKAKAASLS